MRGLPRSGRPRGAGPARLNVEVISAIGGTIADSRGERELNLPLRGGSGAVKVQIPGIRQARGVVPGRGGGKASDAHLLTRHFHLFQTSDTPGRFRHGFVVSAGGKTLKTREFDVEPSPDRRSLVLSSAEGSLTANAFALKPDEDDLVKYHPGLLTASSAVLHRFGVDPRLRRVAVSPDDRTPEPAFEERPPPGGIITGGRLVTSQRNAPPLFGLGLIDALPDEVLVATAAQAARYGPRAGQSHDERPDREIRLEGPDDGPAGVRAGGLRNELGLEAPGHGQAVSPLKPDTKSRALDLTQEECDALAAYVRGAARADPARRARRFRHQSRPGVLRGDWLHRLPPPEPGEHQRHLQRPAHARHGAGADQRRHDPLLRPDRAGRYPDVLQPGRWVGVAHAPALGIPRLGPVSPRRSRA